MCPQEVVRSGYAYALSLCHDPAAAKDLLQEGWLRALKHYPEVNEHLLFRIIRNLHIDDSRRPKVLVLDAGLAEAARDAPSRAGEQRDLEAALGALSTKQREAIYLHVVQGYTAEEIAYETSQSRNTVLSHIRRGKERLRQSLEESETPAREARS